MADFLPYNSSTHKIVELADDWNNLLNHGLEKTATYIVRVNGSYFEAIQGGSNTSAGTIAYGGSGNAGSVDGTSSKAVIDAAIAATATATGKVYIKSGAYGVIVLAAIADGCDVEFERGVNSTVTYSVAADYNGVILDNRSRKIILYNTGALYNNTAVQAPFVDGTTYADSGWDVDAAGEYAATWFNLPSWATSIKQIRIYARSMATEAHAMLATFTLNSGASNEAYNTEAISVADKASETTNFDADDIVYWEIDSGDDADLGHLTGGDSAEFKVVGVAAAGDNVGTDAHFRNIEIEYI